MKHRVDIERRLIPVIKRGSVNELERLLNQGADPNYTTRSGHSLIMWAIRYNKVEMIKLLASRGADLHHTTLKGRSSIHVAVMFKRMEALKALISIGCPLDIIDSYQQSAITYAETPKEYDFIRTLLDAGAKGHPPDRGDLSIGIITSQLETDPAFQTVNSLSTMVIQSRCANPWGENPHIGVVFILPGKIGPEPHFQGIGRGSLEINPPGFYISVVPISSPTAVITHNELLDILHQIINKAEKRFAKARIKYSAEKTREWVERLRT